MLQEDRVKDNVRYSWEAEEDEDLEMFIQFIKTDVTGITSQNCFQRTMKGLVSSHWVEEGEGEEVETANGN